VITARSERATARAIVAVTPMRVSRVVPSEGILTIVAGGTADVSARPLTEEGVLVPGRVALWTSRDSRIATSLPSTDPAEGALVVRGVSAGATTLDVSVDGVRSSVQVVVRYKPAGRVTIVPGTASLLVGETVSAAVAVRDRNGDVEPGRAVVWSSLAPSIATVDSAGTLWARSNGITGIVASVDDVADTMSVVVRTIRQMQITQIGSTIDSRGAVRTFKLKAWDQTGAVIDEQSADWTIKGSGILLDRVGSSARVLLHGQGTSVITATVFDAEVSLTLQESTVIETIPAHGDH
jgi:hypothetical protein